MSIDKNELIKPGSPISLPTLNLIIVFSASAAIICQVFEFKTAYYLLKPLTTSAIIVLCYIFGRRSFKPYYKNVLIALGFCLIGDCFLLSPSGFLPGLISFLAAHLFFLKAFISIDGFKKQLVILLCLLAVAVPIFIYLLPNLEVMKIPVCIYMLVIITMCWQGLASYYLNRNKSNGFLAIGVLLFLFSDSILAVNKFATHLPLADILILSTYWSAILFIANSCVFMNGNQASQAS